MKLIFFLMATAVWLTASLGLAQDRPSEQGYVWRGALLRPPLLASTPETSTGWWRLGKKKKNVVVVVGAASWKTTIGFFARIRAFYDPTGVSSGNSTASSYTNPYGFGQQNSDNLSVQLQEPSEFRPTLTTRFF